MSIDVAPAPSAVPPRPVTPRPRVLRMALIAVTLVASLVAVPTLAVWAWGPGRSSEFWAGHFGDPQIGLAHGTVVPAGPSTVRTWAYRLTTYGLPGDTLIIAAAFGGPVKQVKPGIWATATGTVTLPAGDPSVRAARGSVDALDFRGPTLAADPAAPTFTTPAAQEAEARRILTALGWPDQPGTRPILTVDTRIAHRTAILAAPQIPGTVRDVLGGGILPPEFIFGDDGTLRLAHFWERAVVATPTQTQVISAQQALNDLRHHRSDSVRPESHTPNLVERVAGVNFFDDVEAPRPAGPITTVTLVGDTRGANNGHTNPAWVFTDRTGATVGTVLAVAGAHFPA